jgi:O-antigen/teichoic acid export membrane protein
MLSALAKLGSVAVVGQFALGLAITAPVFMLTNLQLRGVQATDARSEYEFGHYFTLRLVASLCGFVIVAWIVLASGYERTTTAVVMLVAAAKAIESVSDVVAGLLQKHERLDQVAVGLILKGVISVSAFTTAYRLSHRLTLAVLALSCSWAAVALCYDLRLALRLEGSVRRFFSADHRTIARLVMLSAPLGFVLGVSSLGANIPRYAVARYLGQSELGIFASLAYTVLAITFVVNALGQSVVVRLSQLYAAGNYHGFTSFLRRLVLAVTAIGVIAVVCALALGRPLLVLLYRPEYGDRVGVLVVIVVATTISAVTSFLGCGLTAARAFTPQLPTCITGLITVTILAAFLTPKWGLSGAAMAVGLSESLRGIVAFAMLTRTLLHANASALDNQLELLVESESTTHAD